MVSPNTLTDAVTKVPKGCSEGLLALLASRHLKVFEKHTTIRWTFLTARTPPYVNERRE